MNKYEDVPMKDADKSEFDKEAVLATVAIRRMSRTNQWSEDDERRLGVSSEFATRSGHFLITMNYQFLIFHYHGRPDELL